jgi:hypothetical protein
MGLFDFFIRKKNKPARRRKSQGTNVTVRQQVIEIQCQVNSINSILQEHQKHIEKNYILLQEHTQKFKNLEDVLTNPPMHLSTMQTSPAQRPDWSVKPDQSTGPGSCKFDINKFSTQEKLILSAFFNHQDMALSYRDIGSMLGKSANTIKNQMHQILLKADLFERLIDNDMRNRFKLKNGIKVEKYLNISRPSDQPVAVERLS